MVPRLHPPPHLVAGVFCCVLSAADASAQSEPRRSYNLPRGDAATMLNQFADASGRQIVFMMDKVRGVTTNAVKGEFTAREVLQRMIAGTALRVEEDERSGVLTVMRAAPVPPAATRASSELPPEKTVKRRNPVAVIGTWLALALTPGHAQTVEGAAGGARAPGGTIQGRVLNAANGNYLNNARVTIEGSTAETFTNNFGEFRLVDVPAGSVTVRAAFTGLAPETSIVTVTAGQTATRDFNLTRPELRSRPGQDQAVVLDAFIIGAAKEMSGRELALNEQRFAANLKNVVSSDEFGDMAEGNVGEFLKFIPGITIDYVGADARNISVRGLPPLATPVMVDGAPMASAASSGASRIFELEQVSINNVSRVEVTKSPTPDLPASAVGGAVNMISRSAFERARPLFNYRTYLNWNTEERFFGRTNVGPGRGSSVHTNPSFDFSYLRPVNKNFGFTLTGSYSDQYAPDYRAQPTWLPGTSGSALAPASNPFLRNYTTFYGPKVTQRTSVGTTLDWRISHGNVLTLGAQWNYYDAFFSNKNANFNTQGSVSNVAPAAWGPTFTQSQPGAASIDRTSSNRRKYGTTGHLSLKFTHDGPIWKIDAGATYSDSSNHYRDVEKGFVNSFSMTLPNLTLRLGDIDPKISVPRSATVTTATGGAVEWTRLAPYRIGNFVTNQIDSRDLVTSARLNAKRDFHLPFITAPVGVKTGVDVRRMDRDIRAHLRTRYNFVGPDRSNAATSTDDFAGLYDLVDYGFLQDGKSGYGEPWVEYASPYKLYDLFAAHPEYFVEDAAVRIQNHATDSKKLVETISAAYLRTDWRFFNNRLWIVAGVRYERTDDRGEGLKNDITALYQKDASGALIRGANGLPVRLPGLDAATAASLQFIDRGAHAERNYDGFFPSVNLVYNLTENLLLRTSYAKTISRPNLDQIIPGMTITDPNTSNTTNLLITVNNTGLNPWTSENVDLGLEYYFGRGGGSVIAVGGFRKDIKDFFANRRVDATPELLESFGLDDSYLNYDIQYRFNAGDATVTGFDFSYRQGLTFLPNWARGLDVFYNVTTQRLQGTTLADFNNFVRRNDNYGVTLSRPKFTLRVKVNDRGRQRTNLVTGANLPAGTYRFQAPKRMLDIDFEYRIRRGLSLFVAGRNVTNVPSTYQEVYGDGTPEYARTASYWEHGVNYVAGIKGSF